jgi:hypothetical protein
VSAPAVFAIASRRSVASVSGAKHKATGPVDVDLELVACPEPGLFECSGRDRDLVFARDSREAAPPLVLYSFHLE